MSLQQDLPTRLFTLLEPEINQLGYELVELEHISGKPSTLRIFIDTGQGINVDDCAAVSNHVGLILEVEDLVPGEYTLEVSSPGAERPLRSLEHFAAYAGEQVKLKLSELHQGRKRLKGLLQGVDEDKVLVSVDNKEYAIPHRIIIKAHLAPDFSF